MKYRTGFVSNSSSSSFVCDICNEEASGMDMTLSDAQMSRCVNDHIFCNGHMKTPWEDLSWQEQLEILRDGLPESFCPICTFKHLYLPDIGRLYLKELDYTREELLAALASRYSSYREFTDSLSKTE